MSIHIRHQSLILLGLIAFTALFLPQIVRAQNAIIIESEESAAADEFFPEVKLVTEAVEVAEVDASLFGASFIGEKTVTLTEPTHGDLFIAAQTATVDTTLTGDLFTLTQTTTINGSVMGNARLGGDTVIITGTIDGNVLAIAQSVTLAEGATINGHLTVFGESANLQGTVNGSTDLTVEEAILGGTFEKQTRVNASDINIQPQAAMNAAVELNAHDTPVINRDADGLSFINIKPQSATPAPRHDIVQWTIGFLIMGILGSLFITIWPKYAENVNKTMGKQMLRVWERGFLYLFLVPIVILLTALTIIGLPVAILLFILYVLGIFFGHIITATYLGSHMVNAGKFKKGAPQLLAGFWAGLFIIEILFSIPILGFVLTILAGVWGMGAVIQHLLEGRAKKK